MDCTVGIDYMVVPTVSFRQLHVFVVLDHERRRVIHWNVTENPTAAWTALQIKQAFPFDTAPRFMIRDNDPIYKGAEFQRAIAALEIEEVRITPYSPWQNPFVERLFGSVRRDCLDHMIIWNEDHLIRILTEYFRYYHSSRLHQGLGNNSPEPRSVESIDDGAVHSIPYLGGLHHRYTRSA